MNDKQTHRKFILFVAVFQVAVIAIFCVFVRYDEQLDSLFHANRTTGTADGVMDNQYHSKFFIVFVFFIFGQLKIKSLEFKYRV